MCLLAGEWKGEEVKFGDDADGIAGRSTLTTSARSGDITSPINYTVRIFVIDKQGLCVQWLEIKLHSLTIYASGTGRSQSNMRNWFPDLAYLDWGSSLVTAGLVFQARNASQSHRIASNAY